MTLPMHLSKTNEHYTPAEYVQAARDVLGLIDLDPASCAVAQQTVKAERFFTKEENGLAHTWVGSVWLNPPGGRLEKGDPAAIEFGTKSRAVAWWRKLATDFERCHVSEAIFLAFNIELLSNGQDPSERFLSPAGANAICIPEKRIRFTGSSPTHANAILYLGKDATLFSRVFSAFGSVIINK